MHERLRLRRSSVENGAGVPKDLQDVRVCVCDSAYPGDETRVEIETFHGDVLFHGDGQTVQGAASLAMLFPVGVELCCTFEGAFG